MVSHSRSIRSFQVFVLSSLLAWGGLAHPAEGQQECASVLQKLGLSSATRPEAGPGGPSGRAEWRERWQASFHVSEDGDGHRARNPVQSWSTTFDGRGFLVQPDHGDWSWGLELEAYGVSGMRRVGDVRPEVLTEEENLIYRWGGDFEEWYVNGMAGLEHGFTVHRRPDSAEIPDSRDRLRFRLRVRGSLEPRQSRSGRDVEFLDRAGNVVLVYAGLEVLDAAGRSLPARLESSGDRLVVSVDDSGASYPLWIDPTAQQAALFHSNYSVGDAFGYSISLDGDTMVVGAPLEDGSATGINGEDIGFTEHSGACYVFERTGTSWSEVAYVKASNTGQGDFFGVSVALSGDTLAVGAPLEDSGATGVDGDQSDDGQDGAGAVYVFVRDGGDWVQEAYLKAGVVDAGDLFGNVLALEGDRLAVGIIGESSQTLDPSDNSAPDAGAVAIFERDAGQWSQTAFLKASNADPGDYFGSAVALDGDTLVVGATREASSASGIGGDASDNSLASGAAYVFVHDGTSWSEQAYVKASNPGGPSDPFYAPNGDEFGCSVALSGDSLVIGARSEGSAATGVNGDPSNDDAVAAGAAYVFTRTGGLWSQQAYLKASNTDAVDRFGTSVAIEGDTLVVGAPFEDGQSTVINGVQCPDLSDWVDPGAAYAFVRSDGVWSQQDYIKPTYSAISLQFGASLSLSGTTVAAGGHGNHPNPYGSAAFAFTLDEPIFEAYCCSMAAPVPIGHLQEYGASLIASGDPNGSLVLTSTPVPETTGQFFYGPMMLAGSPFGDGLLCVGGMSQRILPFVSAGMMMLPSHTASIAINYSAPYAAGLNGTQHFQYWFRTGVPEGAGFNTSNAISITF